MRLLLKKQKKYPSYLLYLTILVFSIVAFLLTVAVATDSKQLEKGTQTTYNKQKTETERSLEQKGTLHIGTFNPQQVFSMYSGTHNLRKQIQQLQTEKKMTQEQMQEMVKQEQKQLIQKFQSDLSKVIAQSAKDANVPVIAIQVVYRKPSVEIEDLTADLVKKINQQAEQIDNRNNQPVLKQPLLPDTEQK
jgi:peroxiredoxin family protein